MRTFLHKKHSSTRAVFSLAIITPRGRMDNTSNSDDIEVAAHNGRAGEQLSEKTFDKVCIKCKTNFKLVVQRWSEKPKYEYYVEGHEDSNKWTQKNWNGFCQLTKECHDACRDVTKHKLQNGKLGIAEENKTTKTKSTVQRVKPDVLSKQLAKEGFKAMDRKFKGLTGRGQKNKDDLKIIVHVSCAGKGTTYSNVGEQSALSKAIQVLCSSYLDVQNSFYVPSIQEVSNF